MKKYLPFENYICNQQINSSCTVSGNLQCNCGSYKFYILHNGKQTHGILFPYIIGRKLTVIAECSKCKNRIILCGNDTDTTKLAYFSNKNNIILMSLSFDINYFKEKMYKDGRFTTDYELICIRGESEKKKYEEIFVK